MIRYARMALKMGLHLPFGPNFSVEFVSFHQKNLARPTALALSNKRNVYFVTSRKAGQHVLLVQGGTGGTGTFSFLETSVHVKPLENL